MYRMCAGVLGMCVLCATCEIVGALCVSFRWLSVTVKPLMWAQCRRGSKNFLDFFFPYATRVCWVYGVYFFGG